MFLEIDILYMYIFVNFYLIIISFPVYVYFRGANRQCYDRSVYYALGMGVSSNVY